MQSARRDLALGSSGAPRQDLRIREECIGASRDQVDCVLYALERDRVVGSLYYYTHFVMGRKQAYISFIEVLPEHQGTGVARALVMRLAELVPYRWIDWGMLTDGGAALKRAMDARFGEHFAVED